MAKTKVASEEIEKRDRIRSDHAELKATLEKARSNRQFIVDTINDPRMMKVLNNFESSIEDAKEKLVSAEKKDIDGMQATIKAGRQLLATLRGAYDADLDDATRQLKEFEAHNQLFIQETKPETVDTETGEIKTA